MARQYGISNFRLIDQSCTSIENDTHLVVTSSNDQCNTSHRQIDHGIQYRNELFHVNQGERCPYLGVRVSCQYTYFDVQNSRRYKREASSNFVQGNVKPVRRCKTLFGIGSVRGSVAARRRVIGKREISSCVWTVYWGKLINSTVKDNYSSRWQIQTNILTFHCILLGG